MIRVAVLISGRGSNMSRLANAIKKYYIEAKIAIVISNTDCGGISLAKAHGLTTQIIKREDFSSQAEQEAAITEAISDHRADYIFLAGYMAVLSCNFVNQFAGKLVNIHPSLLPAFKGLNTHQRAIDENVKMHGASVHLVTSKLDDGPIIIQAQLPILDVDTADSLAARVLELEHQLYPFVLMGLAGKFLLLSSDGARWHSPSVALANAPSSMQDLLNSCLIWPVSATNAPNNTIRG